MQFPMEKKHTSVQIPDYSQLQLLAQTPWGGGGWGGGGTTLKKTKQKQKQYIVHSHQLLRLTIVTYNFTVYFLLMIFMGGIFSILKEKLATNTHTHTHTQAWGLIEVWKIFTLVLQARLLGSEDLQR